MIVLVLGIIAAIALFVVLGFQYTEISVPDGKGGMTTRRSKKRVWKTRPAQFAALAVLVLALILSCVTVVPTGYTGILTTFGRVEERTISAGAHFILPWQNVVKMDNRTQKV